MDVSGARKFRGSIRLLVSILAVGSLLLASAFWNFQLYRRAEHQRLRAIAAERVSSAHADDQRLRAIADETAQSPRTEAEAEQARFLARRRAERAKDAARVRQLYQELNNLSQLNERILIENSNPRGTSQKKSQPAESGTP